jgi:3-hydroxymyristoyl/3-hydroxydecanoyl-(acyl carrier protein) dehydratase
VSLSPEGHDRLRDIGLEDFLDGLGGGISTGTRALPHICIAPATRAPAIQAALGSTSASPRLLSVLDEPECCRMLLFIGSELDWFKGHFPGTPVLPGVVQLHWAARVARALFNFDRPPATVNRLKFQNVVVPPRVIELETEYVDRGRVRFACRSGAVVHSSGMLRFDGAKSC